ncbi:hypothetical protein V6N13_001796 [Hibiscus sabdariffa]
MLKFKELEVKIPFDEVEPASEIVKKVRGTINHLVWNLFLMAQGIQKEVLSSRAISEGRQAAAQVDKYLISEDGDTSIDGETQESVKRHQELS